MPALCDALVRNGLDNYLVTARPVVESMTYNLPKDRSRVRLAVENSYLRQFGVGRQFCSLLAELSKDQTERTLVHDHAIWLPTNHSVARYCKKHRLMRIVSPRGMLGTWAMSHQGWKKRIAWNLYQKRDLASAQAFHATSEQEADEVRALGFRQPIAVVPNGVDVPTTLPAKRDLGCRQALFLSRIHPKKGLLNLVRAWKEADVSDSWKLLIAGPDEGGHQREVAGLVSQLGISQQIQFTGAFDDEKKWQAYVDSELFVLPSFNENFGIVIAEAMAAGLPVITTTGTPWSVLNDQEMGWWVDPTMDGLVCALREATQISQSKLEVIGARSKTYVCENFTWDSAAKRLAEFYSLLNAKQKR